MDNGIQNYENSTACYFKLIYVFLDIDSIEYLFVIMVILKHISVCYGQ